MMPSDDIKFIMNVLRKGTIKWSGRAECLKNCRRKVFDRKSKKGKPIYKFHWQCCICKEWKRDEKEMEVDHIVEIGGFKGDWNETIKKMYPRPVDKHLQALCVVCHLKKTKAFNAANTKWKRKKGSAS